MMPLLLPSSLYSYYLFNVMHAIRLMVVFYMFPGVTSDVPQDTVDSKDILSLRVLPIETKDIKEIKIEDIQLPIDEPIDPQINTSSDQPHHVASATQPKDTIPLWVMLSEACQEKPSEHTCGTQFISMCAQCVRVTFDTVYRSFMEYDIRSYVLTYKVYCRENGSDLQASFETSDYGKVYATYGVKAQELTSSGKTFNISRIGCDIQSVTGTNPSGEYFVVDKLYRYFDLSQSCLTTLDDTCSPNNSSLTPLAKNWAKCVKNSAKNSARTDINLISRADVMYLSWDEYNKQKKHLKEDPIKLVPRTVKYLEMTDNRVGVPAEISIDLIGTENEHIVVLVRLQDSGECDVDAVY